MDLSSSLKPSTLLALSYSEVSAHFQKLLGQSPPVSHVESINDLLVHRIHSHALPPAIYDIWLPLALRHVPSLLVRALCDKTSAAVRESAIKRVARLFRGSKWKSNGWDALGGAEGIAGIFKQMSAADVRLLSKAIARCRFAKSPSPLTVCVDSLIESMNEDNSRPFFNTLSPLYPLCRPGFHKDLVANLPNAPSTDHLLARLGQVNPSLMREVVIGTAIAPLHVRVSILRSCRRAMVDSPESYYAESRAWSRSEFPPGMNFCLDLCHTMAAHPSLRSALGNDIGLYVQDTLRLAARKNLLFSCIELFFAQLIQLPSYIWPEGSLRTTLTRELASCWSISFYGSAGPNARFCMKSIAHRDHPSHPGPAHQISLERDLCSLLRRYQDPHLARSKHCPWFVDTLTEILCQIAPAGRGPFLVHLCRLSDSLCYGSGYEQFSLDSSVNPPGDREKQVIPVWAYEIMDLLPAQTGQILFDRMLIIHGCADFIPDDVSSHYGLSYERQCQLKAKWEAEMGGEVTIGRQCTSQVQTEMPWYALGFLLTNLVFHELQKRAEGQRDSGKRSDSAIAAIDVANATHSLEVWRLAVQWSKRFLRDTVCLSLEMRLQFG